MDNSDSQKINKRIDNLEKKLEELTVSIERLHEQFGVDFNPEETLESKVEQVNEVKVTKTSDIDKVEQPVADSKIIPPPPPPPKLEKNLIQPDNVEQNNRLQQKPIYHSESSFTMPEHMKSGEYWLNRIGIALLLFGVAFLFKYSIDNGWLTPPIRVAFGLVLGGVVLFLGYRVYEKRRAFAITLLGTGIGIWYITGFAAYQILEIVPHTTAFGFMVLVTITAFLLSLKQNDAILSLIAILGGYGTPFLLYNSSGNLPGLIIYTSIIIACGLGIYFFKGWRSILWLSSVGGWLIFLIGINVSLPDVGVDAFYTRSVSQAGLCFGWLGFWLVPFFRELLHIQYPDKWKKTFVGFADNKLKASTIDILDRYIHLLVISSVLFGLGLSTAVWPDLSDKSWGWIALGLSALYFSVSYFIRKIPQFKTLKYTHGLVAISLFNLAIVLLLDGNTLLFSLATEAMILHLLSVRLSDKVISFVAHIIHAGIAVWMVNRLLVPGSEYFSNSFFDGQTLTDLWVVITYIVALQKQTKLELYKAYGILSILFLTAIFLQELSGNIEMFVITTEGLILFFISRISTQDIYSISYHLLFGIMAVLIGIDFVEYYHKPSYALNLLSLTNLWSIISCFLVYTISDNQMIKRVYILSVILGFALIILREFTGNIEYALLTIEAGLILYATKSTKDNIIQNYGHAAFTLLTVWLFDRFINLSLDSKELAMLNWTALTNFGFIATLAYISRFIKSDDIKNVYRIVAHISFLSLLGYEFARLNNGQGWISVSWGIYGIGLLLIGLRMNIKRFRFVGLGTLLLLVGKLFIVDLAKLETIWRVLLFIGFGGVFLILSYFFRTLWKTEKNKNEVEFKNKE